MIVMGSVIIFYADNNLQADRNSRLSSYDTIANIKKGSSAQSYFACDPFILAGISLLCPGMRNSF